MNCKSMISKGLLASLILGAGTTHGMGTVRTWAADPVKRAIITNALISGTSGMATSYMVAPYARIHDAGFGITDVSKLLLIGMVSGAAEVCLKKYNIDNHVIEKNIPEWLTKHYNCTLETIDRSIMMKILRDYRDGRIVPSDDPSIRALPFGAQMNLSAHLDHTYNSIKAVENPHTGMLVRETDISTVTGRNRYMHIDDKGSTLISNNILAVLSVDEYNLLEALILAALDTRTLPLDQCARIHADFTQWKTWRSLREKLPISLKKWFSRLIVQQRLIDKAQ